MPGDAKQNVPEVVGHILYIPESSSMDTNQCTSEMEESLDAYMRTDALDTLIKPIEADIHDIEDYQLTSKAHCIRHGLYYTAIATLSLYGFLVAIKFIGIGFTLLLGCNSRAFFRYADDPFTALMLGIISTALIHSSSAVTSLITILVSVQAMTLRQAVFIVMGANVGTCVSSMLIAFGQIKDTHQFRRAIAVSMSHNLFNILSVIFFLPLELAFHPIEMIAIKLSHFGVPHQEKNSTEFSDLNTDQFTSPIAAIIEPLTNAIIHVDKNILQDIGSGKTVCHNNLSLIESSLFPNTKMNDHIIGLVVVISGLLLLGLSLWTIGKVLGHAFLGSKNSIAARALNYNGYVNIIAGTILTLFVHSSTVVTCTLTPIGGLGLLTLEQIYPIILGANIGTTSTGLLAATVTGQLDGLAIALVHVIYNIAGVLLFYPFHSIRNHILESSGIIASWCTSWTSFTMILIVLEFYILPIVSLGLLAMCKSNNSFISNTAGASWVIIACIILFTTHWYVKDGGNMKWYAFLEQKRIARELRHLQILENSVLSTHDTPIQDIGTYNALC